MKTYIFYFVLPGGTTIYMTRVPRVVSTIKAEAKRCRMNDEDLDDYRTRLGNELADGWSNTNYSQLSIWRGVAYEDITLKEEVVEE